MLFTTGGTKTQETALSELFGVKYAPVPANAVAAMRLGPNGPLQPYLVDVYGQPQYVSIGPVQGVDFIEAQGALKGRVLLRAVESGKGRAVFSAMNADLRWGWDHDLARQLVKAVNWAAGNPVVLPDGVGGYAFRAKGMTFLVLEDLKYTGGPVEIQLRLAAGDYQAADVLNGLPVEVESRKHAVIVRPSLLPNSGSLIVVRRADSAADQ